MFRSTYLLVILLAISFISSSKQQFAPPYGANARSYNNNNYQNSDVANKIQLSRLLLFDGVTYYYTLGDRMLGNKLLGQSNKKFPPYNQLQDVQEKVWYPNGKMGEKVTFVQIWVRATSPLNNAYVTQGGINQTFISIIIEAKQTTEFGYRAEIYGY